MPGGQAFRQKMVKGYYAGVEKVARPFVRMGVSPNHVTVAGALFSMAAGVLFAQGKIFEGGLVLWLSALMDPLDGTIARLSGKASRFGALLDSTLDRYSEFFIFFGFLCFFRDGWMFWVVLLALMGSLMVSYIKARAESLGQREIGGLMQRPERLILLIAGTVLNGPLNHYVFADCENCTVRGTLLILAVGANFTALQRLWGAKQELA